jgi:hypothetical protein
MWHIRHCAKAIQNVSPFPKKTAVAPLHPNQMRLPRGIFQMALTHGVVIY